MLAEGRGRPAGGTDRRVRGDPDPPIGERGAPAVFADLRESGSLEQDADLIAFIYRDEVYNPKTEERGIAEVIIGKQRNGPIGTAKLSFLNQYTRFENLAEREL